MNTQQQFAQQFAHMTLFIFLIIATFLLVMKDRELQKEQKRSDKLRAMFIANERTNWETLRESYSKIQELKKNPNTDPILIGYLESQLREHSSLLPEDKQDFTKENPYL